MCPYTADSGDQLISNTERMTTKKDNAERNWKIMHEKFSQEDFSFLPEHKQFTVLFKLFLFNHHLPHPLMNNYLGRLHNE